MIADELIETLFNAGCQLIPEGDRLRIKYPDGAITDDLRKSIQKHKAAILQKLKSNESLPKCVAVTIDSSVLGESFWLAANEKVKAKIKAEPSPTNDGPVVYLPCEIIAVKLAGLKGEDLKKLHWAKEIFDGVIMNPN